MTTTTPAATPAELYLASLSEGSQGMRQSLDIIAGILSDGREDADSFAWQDVTYRESMAVRIALMKRYRPSTVNKMLSALRGVLKQTWRLGLVDADAYRRAADVENIRASDLLSGRALEGDEIAQLFATCAADPTPKGARDAAILAVLYGCGLRRGELARLDLYDFDREDGSIIVNGKRRKQRAVYLTEDGCRYVEAWICHRGDAPGPLFCPVSQTGEVRISRMRGESIAYILRRRQEEAGTKPFSPHDLRRSFVTTLLDAGEDVLTVQKLAGHADVGTTARYDRRGESAKRRAVQRLAFPAPGGGLTTPLFIGGPRGPFSSAPPMDRAPGDADHRDLRSSGGRPYPTRPARRPSSPQWWRASVLFLSGLKRQAFRRHKTAGPSSDRLPPMRANEHRLPCRSGLHTTPPSSIWRSLGVDLGGIYA